MRGSDTVNSIFKKIILPCGILAAVGFVVSAVKKKRKERQEAQRYMGFFERAVEEYYAQLNSQ